MHAVKCQKCGGRTEVLETTQRNAKTNRRRQCLHCGHRFTTREQPAEDAFVHAEQAIPEWLRRAARRRSRLDEEAIMAAVRTDRRREEIRQSRLALDRKERDALRDAGLDEQADEIDQDMLQRELRGY